MDDVILPKVGSHWKLRFDTIMKTLPNKTSEMIKFKLIRFFYEPYSIDRLQPRYIVPSPELNLWYVLIGFLIVMPIIFYMVYKEIAAILFCCKSVILTPGEVDLVVAIKKAKTILRSEAFTERDMLVDEVQRNRLGLHNLSDAHKEVCEEVIGDSKYTRDPNHGVKVQ